MKRKLEEIDSANVERYPANNEIKVEWTTTHKLTLVLVTALIFGLSYYWHENISFAKSFSILGLYVDIIGVVIASLKTPFYGIFFDAGKIEIKRLTVEKKYFQGGMFLIGLGMILQAIGTIIQ